MTKQGILVSEAKLQFELGLFSAYGIHRNAMVPGWHVTVISKKQGPLLLVERRQRAVRSFKTADAAISALEEIGFNVDGLVRAT